MVKVRKLDKKPTRALKHVYVCYVTDGEDYDGNAKRGPVEYVCDSQRKADKWLEKRQDECDELGDYETAYATKVEVN